MAYQTPITIAEAITRIQNRKFVLPSIQREFVWTPDQIERLFDSLMREYPISTFLFWNVEKERVNDFQFYEFLKTYHQKTNTHNSKVDLSGSEDVIAILDGQQRLTSLYIGLKGSYAQKLPYYHWSSSHAFPKTKLYLNLLSPAADLEQEYDFRFLTPEELNNDSQSAHWFEVGQILGFTKLMDVLQYLVAKGVSDPSKYTQAEINFASNSLSQLYSVIHDKGTISYYLEKGETLDKVLQIFIRINSGGTKLSYSDLLLSVATAQWHEKDAREVIHAFVDEINDIGDKFAFNKDFVLKSCLVLGDFSDIRFKVDNFTRANMLQIEAKWDEIASAIRTAVHLIARFGFNRDTLTSLNAVIPIAYFVLKNNWGLAQVGSNSTADDRKRIREWLIRVLLKRTFGGTPDNLYPALRNDINANLGHFPLEQIIERSKSTTKPINFSAYDIENLLRIEYSSPLAYSVLALLYPGLLNQIRYQKDHIHPKRFFTDARLKAEGIAEVNTQLAFKERYDLLANLQLLPAVDNAEKNGKHIDQWLATQVEYSPASFKHQHFISEDSSLSFTDFLTFYEVRKSTIEQKLKSALGVD